MKLDFRFIALGLVVLGSIVSCAGTPPHAKKITPVPISQYPATGDQSLVSLANKAASTYGIDNQLFHALIEQESAWDPWALSPKGACGLTQIMPGTGRGECGLDESALFNPDLNLQCGAFYLSKLLRRFGDVELALAAYNSGETRVARWGRIPPIRETQRYVRRIMANWQDSVAYRNNNSYYYYR